jgi:PKD repeat protein
MSFTASIAIGPAPLSVAFIDTTPDSATHGVVSGWSWDFGDGESSTVQNPVHIYVDSGRFDVTLIITYLDLTTETFVVADCIIVAESTLEADTKCLRFSTEQSEGFGWSEFTSYLEPLDNYGAEQVIDDNGIVRDIVFDKNDFLLYETDTSDNILNVNASPIDKEVSEIAWEKHEKETTFDQSEEHKEIKHEVSHVYIRPQDESNRSKSGYTETGLRSLQNIDIEAYLGGEKITYAGKTRTIKENGDAFFQGIPLRNNRVQIVVKGSAGEVKITGHSHEYIGLVGTPSIPNRAQSDYAALKELSKNLLVHIVRSRNPGYDRISKNIASGFVAIAGPDGKNSAIRNADPARVYNTKFPPGNNITILLWAKSEPSFPDEVGMTLYSTTGKDGWYLYYIRAVNLFVPALSWVLLPGDYYDLRVYTSYLSDKAMFLIHEDITMFNGVKTIPLM